ncbi:uncharacterized protein LOC114517065 [Dendronephthya gigantea]|uniref:uncharacterized protein LOC114517065 n=1 Tax=Dendronephthya gigantea TaxID=151771 RepID=UPI00106AA8DC|nr:uncharacterized protein LOC114517065 [Dendronephthya gigantea]
MAMVDSITVVIHEKVEGVVLSDLQPQDAAHSGNDSQKETNCQGQNSFPKRFRNLARSNFACTDIFLKVTYIFLCIPWFISTIFFSIFDTKCVIFEEASVINCTQNFLISNPTHWVFAWLLMSIIASILLIAIIRLNHKKMNYQTEKAKSILKKGYFGSFVFLLLISLVYYVIRIYATRSEKTSISISILVFLWLPVTVVLICCLNYLPRVHWATTVNAPRFTIVWWKDCLNKNSNFIIYWLALVMHFIEVTSKVASIMLDVALEVAPLIENKLSDESNQFRGVLVIVIGFRLAFHVRVLSFFWEKLFHGEKDLFTEPNQRLFEEPLVQKSQQDEFEKTFKLEEVICS